MKLIYSTERAELGAVLVIFIIVSLAYRCAQKRQLFTEIVTLLMYMLKMVEPSVEP